MTTSSRELKIDPAAFGAGTFFTLLAAAGFAAVAILTSLATAAGLSLATVLAWRYTLSAVVLTVWVGLHNYKRIPPREMLVLLSAGGFGQALLVGVALSALRYIPAATLAFLFYTYPAWVALFQSIRGAEKLDARRATALALSFVGIGVMVGMPGTAGIDWRGVALALGAALIYGAYIPMMRVLTKDHPVAPVSAYTKIGSAVAFLVVASFTQSFTYQIPLETWGVLLILTIFSTVLPGVFFLMGLIRLGPVRTAIVSTVEPFLTALLGVVVLSQALTLPTMLGGALIVAAVVLLQFRRDRVA
ncbi:MAG: DMT family transporter [Gemmatimonadaceae bacterium]|nr:DMT family transporter [Gemmatimonadaceae bacterium]